MTKERCSECNKKLRDNGECIRCRQKNKVLDKSWKKLCHDAAHSGNDPMNLTFQIGEGQGHKQYGMCHKCLAAPVEVQVLQGIQQCKKCFLQIGVQEA